MRDRDDAAIRANFAGDTYQVGVKAEKDAILASLPKRFADLHKNGFIHIHDLEGYGKVYNCCTPDLLAYFARSKSEGSSAASKMMDIFSRLKSLVVNVALYQSGGIGFANFDDDIATVFNQNGIDCTPENLLFAKDCMVDLLYWINTTYTRYCREPYYLTFNVGLSTSPWGRKICEQLLVCFKESPDAFVRPNIVFKVNKSSNSSEDSPNFDLYKLALQCTAKRMIPTYLLTDSGDNARCNPRNMGIMGCRTRMYQNCNGREGVIGRGNIAYVSLNLPRLALESDSEGVFFDKLSSAMSDAHDLLIDRLGRFLRNESGYEDWILKNKIWTDVNSLDDMVRQGTLSLGFIGLSETVEVLTGKKFYADSNAELLAFRIVAKMREYVDYLREAELLNYSLLATPAEMLSGRFCDIDEKRFHHKIQKKGFYTNSFHVDVDSRLTAFEKLEKEASFHALCNGGCISYIEFDSVPIHNYEALRSSISFAQSKGISYLGFNFPLDICNDCGSKGTFNNCASCGSGNIKRVRRVSGYLEDLNYFTKGKVAEEKRRRANETERE